MDVDEIGKDKMNIGKKAISEPAAKVLRLLLNDTAEAIQRLLDAMEILASVDADELAWLKELAAIKIEEEKKIDPPKKKRGRPAGSGKKEASGNGE